MVYPTVGTGAEGGPKVAGLDTLSDFDGSFPVVGLCASASLLGGVE